MESNLPFTMKKPGRKDPLTWKIRQNKTSQADSFLKITKNSTRFFQIFSVETVLFSDYNSIKRSVIHMLETQNTDSKLPFTCTPAYDRDACKGCVCSTCYEQEFCDRCSTCTNLARKKEHCNAYEGAYNY